MKKTATIIFLSLIITANILQAEGEEKPRPQLAPFGEKLKVSSRKAPKPAKVKTQAIDCLTPPISTRWMVELPPEEITEGLFNIKEENGKKVLTFSAGELVPKRSTVRILLPGDGGRNGNIWAKNKASYISFLCKSNKPAQMTFHLLKRGKTAGTYQTGFTAKPGEWQKILLPIKEFKLRDFRNIAGIGFRSAKAEKDTTVSITDINIGGMPFKDESWRRHKSSISLRGDWHFKTDPKDQGIQDKWYVDKLDDTSWKVLQSGKSWQEQGIDHYGWGWYRQQIFVPKELSGTALRLELTKIPSDDEAWFNGTRIGGISSEYKYNNWINRIYTVPPALIRYGENNTIAIRIWGGNITFIGNKSGLIKGSLTAIFDPYGVKMREIGGKEVSYDLFDLSDARQGKPFEIVFPFPAEIAKEPGTQLVYRLADVLGNEIQAGKVPFSPGQNGTVQAVVNIDRQTAHTIYLRGRLRASLVVEKADGSPLYCGTREMDRLSFTKRDTTSLPSLSPEKVENTPYGKLKLVDEIDCSSAVIDDIHPYLQGGFDHIQDRVTPGSPVNVNVKEILGKKARESAYGWFAYRIGRGKLKPHSTYLLRIEYPEDKPRFCPVEIQTGQNYMDVGWKNGVGKDDVYDNWPLSNKWQWYDIIVPLDDQTVGTGGTGSAPAENGFWIYFMNKQKPGFYYAMWSGGPAIARIKLYEIDPGKNAPLINKPKDLPNRVLSFDWERQPDHRPSDLVKYAKLMGYNAISPLILKWHTANYSEPLDGYTSMIIDDRDYWSHKSMDPETGQAGSPYPGKKSQHVRYLEATKKYNIDYIPRFEWGGSLNLPEAAKAIDTKGKLTKPNRFFRWCANLLHPATWDDLKKLMDHLVKPYVKDNPQLTGVLWRIRCNRMPISYGIEDIKLFAKETNTPLPPGGDAQWRAWAAGEIKMKYDDWWHKKRAEFHIKLAELLQSYRPGLKLYYFNWDPDKFGIIEPDITAWAFIKKLVKNPKLGPRKIYQKEREVRKSFDAEDYISVMRTGNFGRAFGGLNRADLGIRPDLYKDSKNIQIFCPLNYLCYADKPEYINYFQTGDGLAVSNVVSYDEIGSRSINPKYEGNMITPAGPAFSMALELLAYFHGDARTLNYTVYTYGRGFADAHRRFARAFLALPAIPGKVIEQANKDVKVRTYKSKNGTYVGVAHKGYNPAKLAIAIPGNWSGKEKITDLVSNKKVHSTINNGKLNFEISSGPMELNSYIITEEELP